MLNMDNMFYIFEQDSSVAIVFFSTFYSNNVLYTRRLSIAKTSDSGLNTLLQCSVPTNAYMSVSNMSLVAAGAGVKLRLYY